MDNKHQINLRSNPFITILANQSAEALVILDNTFRVALFNHSAEKIFCLPEKKVIAELFEDICKISNIEFFINPNLCLPSEIQEVTTYIFNKKITWKIQLLKIEQKIYYLLKTIGFTEEENRNEIFKLETLIESMPCNVYWMDKNCLMVGCNENVLSMLGLTREQFIGKSYEELSILCDWPEGLAHHLQNEDHSVLSTGKPIIANEDPPIPNPDGTFSHFLTSRVPLKNRGGDIIGVAGISTEISALIEAREKAQIANNAKTEFIANMSHDIRTPLTGVVGMSKMLEDSVIDSKQKSYAHMLGESGDQLLHMLNGILDVVSADNVNENDLHEESFSLRRMIQDIVELERPTTLVKGIELIATIDESIPSHVLSDHTKIHRILLNLLGNAIKFTKTGHVDVGAKLLKRDETHVVIQFHVTDTGIGIPYELQDKVFDRFFRVTPSYKGIYTGHGVGLHIAQSYAHLLGGNILLTSEPNVGTTFYFDLSLRIGDATKLPTPAADLEASSPQKLPLQPSLPLESRTNDPSSSTHTLKPNAPMVLLVEDNAIALLVLENLITECGCNFMHSGDGLEALNLATTENFDLIITDLGLPTLSGIEFTQKLRAYESEHQKPSIPIIGLTAHADIGIKNSCIKAGMNETYTKPLTSEALKNIQSTYLIANKNVVD